MKLGKWLGLAVAAVILAEGIWTILVSLTRSLLLPLLARVLGGDSHSPLYLGPGDINVPDLFASVLQLCLAGIVFLVIKAWAAKSDELRISPAKKIVQVPAAEKIVQVPAAAAPPAPTPEPAISKPAASMAAAVQTAPAPSPVVTTPAPPPAPTMRTPAPPPAPASQAPAAPKKSAEKPAAPPKPAKPREVYYNIVGEPINPTEDE